jgi:hypothetical protein
MKDRLQKMFSIAAACLLTLTMVGASEAPVAPAAANGEESMPETMPAGLMGTFLAAAAQPFSESGEGYRASAGGLEFTLHGGGLQAKASGLDWGLTLSGIGRGERINPLPEAELDEAEGRLEAHRGSLSEWYRLTPMGAEQGFTIRKPERGTGPLTLHFEVRGDMDCAADGDGRGLSFIDPGGGNLRYDHLAAWDAEGAALEASLSCAPGEARLEVEDRGAEYPITVDPLVYREQKVNALYSDAGHNFGWSVAISDDTALVGAYGTEPLYGIVFVFIRSERVWSMQQKLTASDGAAWDFFGFAVALDGDTALVGAIRDDVGTNTDQGSAYVFTRSGSSWSEQQKLTALDGAERDNFGWSVALDSDTALIGAVHDTVGVNASQGSAYVFTRNGTDWSEQAQLIASDGAAQDGFGYSVALSSDTALVGVPGDYIDSKRGQGSAYIFSRIGTTWNEQAHLIASDGAMGDYFGDSVALSGETALVGAVRDRVGANLSQGSAYVFTRSGTTWSEQAHLTASDGIAADGFGDTVALSGDTAVIAADIDTTLMNNVPGRAYVFTRSGTTWSEQGQLTASDGVVGDYFGFAVALDGSTVLIGACEHLNGPYTARGTIYFFDFKVFWVVDHRVIYIPLVFRGPP